MAVILQNNIGSAISYTDLIFGIDNAMQALTTKIIHTQADSQIEEMIFRQEDVNDDLTRADIVKSFVSVKEQSRDMIEDVLDTLRIELHAALNRAEIRLDVRGMKFSSEDGLVSDVDANLYVTFKV